MILIPEIPYTLEAVCAKIDERRRRGRNFSIVVVAESVRGPAGETITYKDAHGQSRYGGIGAMIARRDRPAHRRRDPGDRARARPARRLADARSIACWHRRSASMRSIWSPPAASIAWSPGRTGRWSTLPIAEAVAQYQAVDPDDALVHTARGLGIAFGDEIGGDRTAEHRDRA